MKYRKEMMKNAIKTLSLPRSLALRSDLVAVFLRH